MLKIEKNASRIHRCTLGRDILLNEALCKMKHYNDDEESALGNENDESNKEHSFIKYTQSVTRCADCCDVFRYKKKN